MPFADPSDFWDFALRFKGGVLAQPPPRGLPLGNGSTSGKLSDAMLVHLYVVSGCCLFSVCPFVCLIYCYCLELMSRLRAGPDEVSGVSDMFLSLAGASVLGAVPGTG